MSNKKILIVLLIIIGLAIGILVYLKKKAASTTAPAMTVIPGGASGSTAPPPPNNLMAVNTGNTNANSGVTRFPLQMGSQGLAVQMLQAILNIPITGVWDSQTDVSVRNTLGVSSVDLQTFANTVNATSDLFPIQEGDSGSLVAIVQILTGATPDGIFGPKTAAALQATTGDTAVYGSLQYINLINSVLGVNIGFSTSTNDLEKQSAVLDNSFTSQISYL